MAGSDAKAFTSTGVSALHLVAAAGDQNAVATLLFYGAEVDVLDLHSGRTPLMFATASNRLEVIERCWRLERTSRSRQPLSTMLLSPSRTVRSGRDAAK